MTTSVKYIDTLPTEILTSTTNSAVTFLSYCNNSANPVVINMYVVPAGVTISDECLLYVGLEIPPYDTYQIYVGNEKLVLSPGDALYATASIGATISSVLSYTGF